MTSPEKYEIQIGEHGSETCVGIRPPLPDKVTADLMAKLPARDRPIQVVPERSKGGKPYTLLRFGHVHFGKYRNENALNAIEAAKTALINSGATVSFDEDMRDLSGDNKLFG